MGGKRNTGIPALGFELAIQILLFFVELGTCILEVPRLMTMTETEGYIFIVQGLCPVEISNLEVDLIRQSFADIYFCTYSVVGVESIVPSRGICSEEAS